MTAETPATRLTDAERESLLGEADALCTEVHAKPSNYQPCYFCMQEVLGRAEDGLRQSIEALLSEVASKGPVLPQADVLRRLRSALAARAKPAPSGDEREALARLIRPWTRCDDGGGFDHGSVRAADAVLAAGYRRSDSPAPSGDDLRARIEARLPDHFKGCKCSLCDIRRILEEE